MRKKKIQTLGIMLLTGMLLCGCNGTKGTENTQQAFSAVEALEYEEALQFFAAAAEAGENPQVIARGQGLAYLGLAKYTEAIEQFLTALTYSDEFIDEFDYDTNYYLATAYFKNGQVREAGEIYSAILALRDDKNAHYLRGLVYLEEDKLEDAKFDFDTAIRMDKEDYDLCINVCQALMEKGYEEEGKAYLQAALGNNGKKLSDFQKGKLSYYQGDYEGAINYLEATKKNKDADTVLLLGQAYEKLGDYNYAASIYSNYLSEHSEDVVICNRLGMCKLQGGDAESALTYFEQALALEDPGMTQVLKFNQIAAYEHLGDFAQANVLMKNYLALYPDDMEALREYEFLKTR